MAQGVAVSYDHEAQPTDQQVVAIVRTGVVEEFEVLVDRYYDSLTRHLALRTGDAELGADFAQDVFLDAFRNLDRFDGQRSFAAWLYGIAHKRLLMYWRRQRMRRLISLDWLTRNGLPIHVALQQPDGSEPCHERDIVSQVFGELTPSLRDALLLHSQDGFTAPEIAGILGISLTAAERRVSRARQVFRQRYDELNSDGEEHAHG